MTGDLIVCDLAEARTLAAGFDTVITAGPPHKQLGFTHPNHHIETFVDVTAGPMAPTVQKIRRLIRFAKRNTNNTLVHCHRGESRSTAVGIGILIARGMNPLDAYEILKAAQPAGRAFIPNPLILSHLEVVLDRPGLVVDLASVHPLCGALLPNVTSRTW